MTQFARLLCVSVVTASLFFVAACATRSPERSARLSEIASQEIICEDEAACRRMWAKASRWAEDNKGFRFIERDFNRLTVWCSFVRSDTNYTAFVIERIPIEGEKSRLTLTMGSDSAATPCAPIDELATQASFKQAVLS
jgi:hypothetical protein